LLESFNGQFDMEEFHKRKKAFVLPYFSVNAYAGTNDKFTQSPRPILHQQLRKVREAICAKKDLPIYIVAGSSTIDEMALYLPQTLEELRKITGFGDAKVKQYGQQFLDVIVAYSIENDLSSLIHEKNPKRERKERGIGGTTGKSNNGKVKGETHAESFKLYKEGKSIAEIAAQRNLTVNTIEGHLAKFVRRGDISINELVSSEKLVLIEAALKDFDGISISPIKQSLGEGISFGEIKLVMAGLELSQQRVSE